jgi:hypothetical protein
MIEISELGRVITIHHVDVIQASTEHADISYIQITISKLTKEHTE